MRGIVRSINIVIVLFIAIGGVAVQSASPDVPTNNDQAPAPQIDKQQMIEQLSAIYKHWADASIKGEKEGVAKYGKHLIALVNEDIAATEFRVRELARLAILTDAAFASEETDRVKSKTELEPNRKFQQGLSLLNIKETLFRTLNKSRDFASRYRLMGNYIDLLRDELMNDHPVIATTPAETEIENRDHTPTENR